MHAMTSHCFHERLISLLFKRLGTARNDKACASLPNPGTTVQSGAACQARPYEHGVGVALRERRRPGAIAADSRGEQLK
ncbi:MAG TPA: hypothetical protein DCY47_20740 [Candidatus Accumulibacter sp.]|nr:hypothetical protein [Accumulibacter sp.]